MVVLLAVRFLAELGMLAALAWGGWHLTDSTALAVLLALALPAAAASASCCGPLSWSASRHAGTS